MKTKFSFLPVISLVLSIVTTTLYYLIFSVRELFVIWMLASMFSAFAPLMCKGVRKTSTKIDSFLEITALVIGLYNFYSVLFLSTQINTSIIIGIVAIICVIYSKIPVKTREVSASNNLTEYSNRKTEFDVLSVGKTIDFCKNCGCIHDRNDDLCLECAKEVKRGSRKGIIRIVLGSLLILLQLCVFMTPSPYNVTESFEMNYSLGIYGIILLCYGIGAYKTRERAKYILHTQKDRKYKIVKWFFVVLLMLSLVYYIALIRFQFKYGYLIAFTQLFSTYAPLLASIVFLMVYLVFYIGKKPCCLLSISFLFAGYSYLATQILSFNNMILYNESYPYLFYGNLLSFVAETTVGILYTIMAVKLYKECRINKWIYIFGWASIALLFINTLGNNIIMYATGYLMFSASSIIALIIRIATVMLLPISLFVYTCIIKVNLTKEMVDYENKVLFCRKCGMKLIHSSKYCSNCGTEVVEVEA